MTSVALQLEKKPPLPQGEPSKASLLHDYKMILCGFMLSLFGSRMSLYGSVENLRGSRRMFQCSRVSPLLRGDPFGLQGVSHWVFVFFASGGHLTSREYSLHLSWVSLRSYRVSLKGFRMSPYRFRVSLNDSRAIFMAQGDRLSKFGQNQRS